MAYILLPDVAPFIKLRYKEETAAVNGSVEELARIHAEVNLGQEMGDRALNMLSRVFSGEFEGFDSYEHAHGR